MGSKDKRMCTETGNNNKVGLYEAEDDCLGDFIPNILEYPVDSLGLDEDCLTEDWESKLGPIPSEVFPGMLPPGGIGIVGGGAGGYPDHLTVCDGSGSGSGSGSSVGACEAKFQPPTRPNGKKLHLIPKPFQAPSPDSVLDRRTSSSSWALASLRSECKRTRTKRLRRLSTSWPKLGPTPVPNLKQKRRIHDHHVANVGVKKCSHCEITKTPQWREGPMGPKTLCNACGVRYRSGRLFPEYRPAASPTFVPALHSNSHRKVVELRKKAAGIDDKP